MIAPIVEKDGAQVILTDGADRRSRSLLEAIATAVEQLNRQMGKRVNEYTGVQSSASPPKATHRTNDREKRQALSRQARL